jgi:hypothetical protein
MNQLCDCPAEKLESILRTSLKGAILYNSGALRRTAVNLGRKPYI